MQTKTPVVAISSKLLLAISLCARPAVAQQSRKSLATPAPVYPDVAKRLNLEGTVRIAAAMGPNGQIKETKAVGGHPVLVDSVLKALHDWKYEKASSETTVQLEFKFHP